MGMLKTEAQFSLSLFDLLCILLLFLMVVLVVLVVVFARAFGV